MRHHVTNPEPLRRLLRRCGAIWQDPTDHDEADVLEALATLLAAYGLGSRTAEAALTDPSRRLKGWKPPARERALEAAADVMRLAEDLRGVAQRRPRGSAA